MINAKREEMEQREIDYDEEARIEAKKKRAAENEHIADNMRDYWKHQQSGAEGIE